MTRQERVRLHTWWKGEISKLTAKVMMDEERRQARRNALKDKVLEEYRTEQEVLDAYGYGIISAREKNRILNLMEKKTEEDPLYAKKLELLTELYQDAERIITENSQGGYAS